MRQLDDTDLRILELLVEDARRPFSEIADDVGLASPTVSDRVDRLQDLGVIRQFTLDVDRSALVGGVDVLVNLQVRPGRVADVRAGVEDLDAVERVFVSADTRIFFRARVPDGDVEGVLADAVEADALVDYDAHLLVDETWTPRPAGEAFALECAECENTVTGEGETARIDGDVYQFCCPSCRDRFSERYEAMREGV